MFPRWRYCNMLKYFLVLSAFIGLSAVFFHHSSPKQDEDAQDKRAIEDQGGTCCFCSANKNAMCNIRHCKVEDKVLTLSVDLTAGKRILVIGDVHGCLLELTQLLQQAGVLKTRDLKDGLNENSLVVFVGDLVNKGPHSLEVLDFAMETEGVYTVRGNHECYWIGRKKSPRHMDFMDSLPYIISIPGHNALIVHAGLYGGVPLAEQLAWDIVHMRNVIPKEDGTFQADTEDTVGVHWATQWNGPEHIYYGHDARRGKDEEGIPRVQRFPLVTGLDTGCVKGRALTGVVLPVEKEEFYTVKAQDAYFDKWS